jgi:hypothetical protein
MSERGRSLAVSRQLPIWPFAPAAAVAVWLLSFAGPEERAPAKADVTVVTARPKLSQSPAVPVRAAVVQFPVPVPHPAAPALAAAPPEERFELPTDLAAIEGEGSTEPPLGEGGAALDQP